eukprot:3618037-Rhodomonas_salina.1
MHDAAVSSARESGFCSPTSTSAQRQKSFSSTAKVILCRCLARNLSGVWPPTSTLIHRQTDCFQGSARA